MELNENQEKFNQSDQLTQPSWGLVRTIKYGITSKGKATKLNTTGDDYIKMNKQVFMNKDFLKNTMIVKIEFTVQTDGRVFTRGKGILGRDEIGQGSLIKDFYQVTFKDETNPSKKIIIINISAGDVHVLALDSQMNVWAWGSNKFKQIMISNENEYPYPVLVDLKRKDLQLCQIFALSKTSLYVCKNNRIFMVGSTKEGFLGNYNNNKKLSGGSSSELIEMLEVNKYIGKQMMKSSKNFEEQFLNSKKLFSSKYNMLLKDNYVRTIKVQDQISLKDILYKDVEIFCQNPPTIINKDDLSFLSPLQVSLFEIDAKFKSKLIKIKNQREEIRTQMNIIEREIKIKNMDILHNTSQLDRTEGEMEAINSLRGDIKEKLNNPNIEKKELKKKLADLNAKYNDLSNHKEYRLFYKRTLMENLKILIIFLESKERERHEIAMRSNQLIDKEIEFYRITFVMEDIIDITLQILPNDNNTTEKKISLSEEILFRDLFIIYEKINVSKFNIKNNRYPFKILEDIIQGVDKELDLLEKELDIFSERLSEKDRTSFSVLMKMLKMYIELINEQNSLILILHKVLLQLKPQILNKEKIRRSDENHQKHKEKLPDVEFIYKDLILEILNSVKNKDNYEDLFYVPPPKNHQNLINEYKSSKKTLYDKLDKRSKIGKEKTNDGELQTFTYGKPKDKSLKSLYSW